MPETIQRRSLRAPIRCACLIAFWLGAGGAASAAEGVDVSLEVDAAKHTVELHGVDGADQLPAGRPFVLGLQRTKEVFEATVELKDVTRGEVWPVRSWTLAPSELGEEPKGMLLVQLPALPSDDSFTLTLTTLAQRPTPPCPREECKCSCETHLAPGTEGQPGTASSSASLESDGLHASSTGKNAKHSTDGGIATAHADLQGPTPGKEPECTADPKKEIVPIPIPPVVDPKPVEWPPIQARTHSRLPALTVDIALTAVALPVWTGTTRYWFAPYAGISFFPLSLWPSGKNLGPPELILPLDKFGWSPRDRFYVTGALTLAAPTPTTGRTAPGTYGVVSLGWRLTKNVGAEFGFAIFSFLPASGRPAHLAAAPLLALSLNVDLLHELFGRAGDKR